MVQLQQNGKVLRQERQDDALKDARKKEEEEGRS